MLWCLPSDMRHTAAVVYNWKRVISDELQVTEAEVAQHFADCGPIMDCRVCGDPNSAMRFAFVEFSDETNVMQVTYLPFLEPLSPCPGFICNAAVLMDPLCMLLCWF